MCIRDSLSAALAAPEQCVVRMLLPKQPVSQPVIEDNGRDTVSYTHLRIRDLRAPFFLLRCFGAAIVDGRAVRGQMCIRDRLNEGLLEWDTPLIWQGVLGSAIVTGAELVTGMILNCLLYTSRCV